MAKTSNFKLEEPAFKTRIVSIAINHAIVPANGAGRHSDQSWSSTHLHWLFVLILLSVAVVHLMHSTFLMSLPREGGSMRRSNIFRLPVPILITGKSDFAVLFRPFVQH